MRYLVPAVLQVGRAGRLVRVGAVDGGREGGAGGRALHERTVHHLKMGNE